MDDFATKQRLRLDLDENGCESWRKVKCQNLHLSIRDQQLSCR